MMGILGKKKREFNNTSIFLFPSPFLQNLDEQQNLLYHHRLQARRVYIVSHHDRHCLHGQTPEDAVQWLEGRGTESFLLLELDYGEEKEEFTESDVPPLRTFCVKDKTEWESLKEDSRFQKNSFSTKPKNFKSQQLPFFDRTFEIYMGFADSKPQGIAKAKGNSNNELAGSAVSTWVVDPSITNVFEDDSTDPFWPYKVELMFSRFFGDRNSVACGGLNGYIGPRNSNQPNPSPNYGPGSSTSEAHYTRMYYSNFQYRSPSRGSCAMPPSLSFETARPSTIPPMFG
jgi:hypothetical protein